MLLFVSPIFLAFFFGGGGAIKIFSQAENSPEIRESEGRGVPFFLRGSFKSIFVIVFVRNHSTKDVTLQFYVMFLFEKIFGSIFGPLRAILVLFATFCAFWEITFPFFFLLPQGRREVGFFLLSGPADR